MAKKNEGRPVKPKFPFKLERTNVNGKMVIKPSPKEYTPQMKSAKKAYDKEKRAWKNWPKLQLKARFQKRLEAKDVEIKTLQKELKAAKNTAKSDKARKKEELKKAREAFKKQREAIIAKV